MSCGSSMEPSLEAHHLIHLLSGSLGKLRNLMALSPHRPRQPRSTDLERWWPWTDSHSSTKKSNKNGEKYKHILRWHHIFLGSSWKLKNRLWTYLNLNNIFPVCFCLAWYLSFQYIGLRRVRVGAKLVPCRKMLMTPPSKISLMFFLVCFYFLSTSTECRGVQSAPINEKCSPCSEPPFEIRWASGACGLLFQFAQSSFP